MRHRQRPTPPPRPTASRRTFDGTHVRSPLALPSPQQQLHHSPGYKHQSHSHIAHAHPHPRTPGYRLHSRYGTPRCNTRHVRHIRFAENAGGGGGVHRTKRRARAQHITRDTVSPWPAPLGARVHFILRYLSSPVLGISLLRLMLVVSATYCISWTPTKLSWDASVCVTPLGAPPMQCLRAPRLALPRSGSWATCEGMASAHMNAATH